MCNFRKRAARRMATGSNQAHSIRTFFVEKEISVSAPPMIPPMPTAREPSPSLIMQRFESSWRSMPSSVLIFSPGLRFANDDFVVAHFVVVEGVQRVPELQHHVVRNIDDVADAGDAGGFEAVFQPFGRRLDFYVSNDARGEAAAEFGRLDFDFEWRRWLWRTHFPRASEE